jgi:hypothetical protein
MEARYVQLHLRRCGVVVHHATEMPTSADGRQAVVVFLEGGLQQFQLARRCAIKLPGVIDVSFSGHTATIMYVFGAPPRNPATQQRPPEAPEPGPEQRSATARPVDLRPSGTGPETKRAPGPVRSPGAARRRTTARQQN